MDYKLALVQHPMYFLIRADSVCAERTPPWGAENIEEYIERIRENLSILRKYPQLRLGYEWSAYELELLYLDAPDVFDEMMEMVRSGRCTLYNGTYSQPHLQILSSESNFRQFDVATKVYRELCHHQVKTYAHQECSLNEQTPQLLNAFGIKTMPLPYFISTLVVEGGEFAFHSKEGTMTIHGSEFTQWRGLDGTLIDVYLEEPAHLKINDWIRLQEIKGLLHAPPIIIDMPDMVSVNDQWLEDRKKVDFVLLDDELPKRLEKYPPRFQSRIYTNWSYIEGIRAEELSRNNFLAEQGALYAEAMNVMANILIDRKPHPTDAIWKTILATQHHDVYCFCGLEIKEKSIRWLLESQAKTTGLINLAAEDMLSRIASIHPERQQIVLFNTNPSFNKAPVSVVVEMKNPAIFDIDGQVVPCEITPINERSSKISFLAESRSFGYTSYEIRAGGKEQSNKVKAVDRFIFENQYYQCTVLADGTISSLKLGPNGEELLDILKIRGNQLAGQDSTDLGSKHEGIINIGSVGSGPVYPWEPPARGPELNWQLQAQAEILESPLGTTFTAIGRLNSQIQADLQIVFLKDFPRIDFVWNFEFHEASVGSFFDDETKLRVQWPLSFSGLIQHDIAFGVVASLEERPFFPASWVDISDDRKGLAYFHHGTIKHWVKDQTLINLFAWGEDTDAIGNRMGIYRWPKTFDQRLDGLHTIKYSIYPHAGDWRMGNVIQMARSITNPPLPFIKAANGSGDLPPQKGLFQIGNPDHIATAIKMENSDFLCRLYSVSLKEEPVQIQVHGLEIKEITMISGETTQNLAPYKIGKILLKKGSRKI